MRKNFFSSAKRKNVFAENRILQQESLQQIENFLAGLDPNENSKKVLGVLAAKADAKQYDPGQAAEKALLQQEDVLSKYSEKDNGFSHDRVSQCRIDFRNRLRASFASIRAEYLTALENADVDTQNEIEQLKQAYRKEIEQEKEFLSQQFAALQERQDGYKDYAETAGLSNQNKNLVRQATSVNVIVPSSLNPPMSNDAFDDFYAHLDDPEDKESLKKLIAHIEGHDAFVRYADRILQEMTKTVQLPENVKKEILADLATDWRTPEKRREISMSFATKLQKNFTKGFCKKLFEFFTGGGDVMNDSEVSNFVRDFVQPYVYEKVQLHDPVVQEALERAKNRTSGTLQVPPVSSKNNSSIQATIPKEVTAVERATGEKVSDTYKEVFSGRDTLKSPIKFLGRQVSSPEEVEHRLQEILYPSSKEIQNAKGYLNENFSFEDNKDGADELAKFLAIRYDINNAGKIIDNMGNSSPMTPRKEEVQKKLQEYTGGKLKFTTDNLGNIKLEDIDSNLLEELQEKDEITAKAVEKFERNMDLKNMKWKDIIEWIAALFALFNGDIDKLYGLLDKESAAEVAKKFKKPNNIDSSGVTLDLKTGKELEDDEEEKLSGSGSRYDNYRRKVAENILGDSLPKGYKMGKVEFKNKKLKVSFEKMTEEEKENYQDVDTTPRASILDRGVSYNIDEVEKMETLDKQEKGDVKGALDFMNNTGNEILLDFKNNPNISPYVQSLEPYGGENLLIALIAKESRGKVSAENEGSMAMGLMQITPKTAFGYVLEAKTDDSKKQALLAGGMTEQDIAGIQQFLAKKDIHSTKDLWKKGVDGKALIEEYGDGNFMKTLKTASVNMAFGLMKLNDSVKRWEDKNIDTLKKIFFILTDYNAGDSVSNNLWKEYEKAGSTWTLDELVQKLPAGEKREYTPKVTNYALAIKGVKKRPSRYEIPLQEGDSLARTAYKKVMPELLDLPYSRVHQTKGGKYMKNGYGTDCLNVINDFAKKVRRGSDDIDTTAGRFAAYTKKAKRGTAKFTTFIEQEKNIYHNEVFETWDNNTKSKMEVGKRYLVSVNGGSHGGFLEKTANGRFLLTHATANMIRINGEMYPQKSVSIEGAHVKNGTGLRNGERKLVPNSGATEITLSVRSETMIINKEDFNNPQKMLLGGVFTEDFETYYNRNGKKSLKIVEWTDVLNFSQATKNSSDEAVTSQNHINVLEEKITKTLEKPKEENGTKEWKFTNSKRKEFTIGIFTEDRERQPKGSFYIDEGNGKMIYSSNENAIKLFENKLYKIGVPTLSAGNSIDEHIDTASTLSEISEMENFLAQNLISSKELVNDSSETMWSIKKDEKTYRVGIVKKDNAQAGLGLTKADMMYLWLPKVSAPMVFSLEYKDSFISVLEAQGILERKVEVQPRFQFDALDEYQKTNIFAVVEKWLKEKNIEKINLNWRKITKEIAKAFYKERDLSQQKKIVAAGVNPTHAADNTLVPFGKQIQQQLKDLGYDIGKIDGKIGVSSLNALAEYFGLGEKNGQTVLEDTPLVVKEKKDTTETQSGTPAEIIAIHSVDEYKQMIEKNKNSDKPLYVYFSADNCGYCKKTTPVYKNFSSQNTKKAIFARVHMDIIKTVVEKYGKAIPNASFVALPVVQVFHKGKLYKDLDNAGDISRKGILGSYLK